MASKQGKKFPRWVGITAIVIAVLLALALAFSFITKGGTDMSKFKTKNEDPEADLGGITLEDDELVENGVKLTARKLARSEYAAYGVSTGVEDALTITATAKEDQDKIVQEAHFTWTANWAGDGVWSASKEISNYITLQGANTNTITISCNSAFGEVIELKVKCSEAPNVEAKWTLHYLQKYKGATNVIFRYSDADSRRLDISWAGARNEELKKEIGSASYQVYLDGAFPGVSNSASEHKNLYGKDSNTTNSITLSFDKIYTDAIGENATYKFEVLAGPNMIKAINATTQKAFPETANIVFLTKSADFSVNSQRFIEASTFDFATGLENNGIDLSTLDWIAFKRQLKEIGAAQDYAAKWDLTIRDTVQAKYVGTDRTLTITNEFRIVFGQGSFGNIATLETTLPSGDDIYF